MRDRFKGNHASQSPRRHTEHVEAKRRGRADWYESYRLRIARVEQAWGFSAGGEAPDSGLSDEEENQP